MVGVKESKEGVRVSQLPLREWHDPNIQKAPIRLYLIKTFQSCHPGVSAFSTGFWVGTLTIQTPLMMKGINLTSHKT